MHPRRLIGSLLATALAATTMGVVVTAAPAQAVDTVETRIVPGLADRPILSSYKKQIEYGDDISAYVDVEAFVGGVWKSISNGSVTVSEQLVGSATATTVATGTYASVSDSFPAHGSATYTISYSGGTGEYPAVNYAPTSATTTVGNVHRKLKASTYSGRSTGVKGKLAPAKKIKITVLKKHGKKFKKYKVVRTSKNGHFKIGLPAPRRGKLFWKIKFAGDSLFVPTTVRVKTYKL